MVIICTLGYFWRYPDLHDSVDYVGFRVSENAWIQSQGLEYKGPTQSTIILKHEAHKMTLFNEI